MSRCDRPGSSSRPECDEESATLKGIISVLLLLVIVVTTLAACDGGISASKELLTTICADGTRGCKQEPGPVILWNRAGAGAAHGKGITEIPHGTRLEVHQTKEHFGINYYQVVYEGQRGWVPENFVSETEPICP